jgi:hypothetical protein
MIQWTPGAGAEPIMDRRWWPLYHRTVEAGKKVALLGFSGVENLRTFRKEFGRKLKHFLISLQAPSPVGAEEMLRIVSE